MLYKAELIIPLLLYGCSNCESTQEERRCMARQLNEGCVLSIKNFEPMKYGVSKIEITSMHQINEIAKCAAKAYAESMADFPNIPEECRSK